MPSKVQIYAQMADRTAEQITGSYQKWTAFLTTAARLYKYPYNEQLMIFAQRPEATACAEYDLWNKQMRRYVRRGSKGIALVDTSSDQPKLRYVFDVSDTSGGENSRRPYLWEYRQEHREVVSAALEQRFDVSGESGLADQLERVAAQNTGTTIGAILSASLTVPFWRTMMSSTSEPLFGTPPLSAPPMRCCPAAGCSREITSNMRIF